MTNAHRDRPEISDLVVAYDSETLERQPVHRDVVLAELARHRLSAARRVVARWPHHQGILDARHVDAVLVRAHHELLRLSEEFRQGERMKLLLEPLLQTLRAERVAGPYVIVDVGCGMGYVVRWLAARGQLGADVVLVGCDYNRQFIHLAQRLADQEQLPCRFVVANAFRLEEHATLFISTGVIHHFRDADLPRFLAAQARSRAIGFVHSDIKASYLAPLGSWLFHRARMREPLARHDGVLSALRAHSARVLASAARSACPNFAVGVFDGKPELLPVLRVMNALVGLETELAPAFLRQLGPLAARLEDFA
jgi:2-polyprenyl-3-methyl-5-hydroxy-6-metoxy-1,4-benzoquinol methylase